MSTSEAARPAMAVSITPVQHMISSCTGAVLTSLLMTPFDVVKIRLQSQSKPSSFAKGHCFLYCNGLMDHICPCVNGTTPSQWYVRPSHFNGTFDAMVKIVRNEGVASLWSGLPPTLAMAVPATVVYFTSYEQLKYKFGYKDGSSGYRWEPMAAGAIARVWAASLISPIEMIRTKMQSRKMKYSQIQTAVKDTIRRNGILSLWKGLGPTLLRDVPFSAMYWTGYELTKTYVIATKGHSELTFYESFGAGALAGSIAAVMTLPFDVIKTRRQVELGKELTGRLKESTSTWKIISKIYTTEGFRALFSGLPPRLMKVTPSCAIMISTFEYFKRMFAARNSADRVDSFNVITPSLQVGPYFKPLSGNHPDFFSKNHEDLPIVTLASTGGTHQDIFGGIRQELPIVSLASSSSSSPQIIGDPTPAEVLSKTLE